MVGSFRKWVRKLGYDISPFPGSAKHWGRIVETLNSHSVDCLLDIGANTGQYARAIRANGYSKKIISFEPLSHIRHELKRQAAEDLHWDIAPRMAVGATVGSVEINVSGESDMSSIRPLDTTAYERLASTRAETCEPVPVTTIARILEGQAAGAQNIFLKSDTQGYEDKVLDGIGSSWDRITGLQIELSMQPIYKDQPDHLPLLQRLADQGFQPHLVIPGYWSRHYGRMLEYDAVFFRD